MARGASGDPGSPWVRPGDVAERRVHPSASRCSYARLGGAAASPRDMAKGHGGFYPAERVFPNPDCGFGPFVRPSNSARQGHRAAIDMDMHVLRNSGIIVQRLLPLLRRCPGQNDDVCLSWRAPAFCCERSAIRPNRSFGSARRRRSAAPQRQHRARRFPHHVLCRRAKEQEVGRSTPLHAHDDQITLSLCGDAQNFAPGLSRVINDSTLQNSGAPHRLPEDAGVKPPHVSSGNLPMVMPVS